MSLSKQRSLLYKLARLLGDMQSVRRGTAHKRVARRVVGRQSGRLLRRLFR